MATTQVDALPRLGGPDENLILSALPPGELSRLLEHGESRMFDARHRLAEPGAPMSHVFFPLSGVVSLITTVSGGSGVEVAMVGREGMVGVPIALGGDSWPNVRVVQQVRGRSLAIETGRFRAVLDRSPALHAVLDAYVRALLSQAAQEIACNRLHAVEERTSRWLLITHDRVGTRSFPLTQEFLAEVLGVRRPSVSIAAGALARAGAIRYHRGRIHIVKRAELERHSCECYRVIRDELDRLRTSWVRPSGNGDR
ncbi:MAG TPA: Crp/Fnr family transcriptional regulator [Actinomycetota bacterium]|jgi:CRP-like cAMP-binding protein|nr:Crp/Fnr family transcriptional regulator [Actinomycetota bacterium]